MALIHKVVVRLTIEDRDALDQIAQSTQPVALRRRAQILLLSDADGPEACTDAEIAEHLEISTMTIAKVRQQFAAEGLAATVRRKRPTGRQYRKLDGLQEARLIALACSPAPEGRARWTMKLLADRLVVMEVVESIDPSTVYRTLKKTNSSHGFSSSGYSRRRRTPVS